jgi:hypothetical protein
MSTPLTIECALPCRHGRGSARELVAGPTAALPAVVPGRVPRLARLMALAIRFDGLLRAGFIQKQAELARLGHVSRARIAQILGLVHLAPDLQEAILFLPRIQRGRAPLILAQVLPIAAIADWKKQRRRWRALGQRQRVGVGQRRVARGASCRRPPNPLDVGPNPR